MAENAKKEAASVLYSGGSDSTLAAVKILEEYEKVTLLTFDPGFIFFLENSRKHVPELQQKFGAENVSHKIINISHAIRNILFHDVKYDLKKYGFNIRISMDLQGKEFFS